MNALAWVGGVGAWVGAGAYLPHCMRAVRRRSAADWSWTGLVCTGVSLGMWVAYGVGVGNWLMVSSDVTALAVWACVVGVKVAYGEEER